MQIQKKKQLDANNWVYEVVNATYPGRHITVELPDDICWWRHQNFGCEFLYASVRSFLGGEY